MNTLTGRRVLVVEDETLIAMDLCYTLDDEGATVVGPVASVEDALLLMDAGQAVDAAVLDISLGDGNDVFSLADLLSARGVPYIFSTGYDDTLIPSRYRDVPMCRKPGHVGSIVDAVSLQINRV